MNDGPHRDRRALTLVELADVRGSIDAHALRAQAMLVGVDADVAAMPVIAFAHGELDAPRRAAEEVLAAADRLRYLVDAVPVEDVVLSQRDLARQAAVALSLGVADLAHARLLARCLPAPTGFRALAEMLRCTDCHHAWQHATLSDVLDSFRDVEPPLLRWIAERARLDPNTPLAACGRAEIPRLAGVLEAHARTDRSS